MANGDGFTPGDLLDTILKYTRPLIDAAASVSEAETLREKVVVSV